MGSSADYILVDANVWLAYFNTEDTLHRKAVPTLERLEDKLLLVTDWVLQEVLTSFLYKNQSGLIPRFMDKLNNSEHFSVVRIDSDLYRETIQFMERQNYKPKISLADWSLAFLSTNFELPLLTFDKQLKNLLGRLT